MGGCRSQVAGRRGGLVLLYEWTGKLFAGVVLVGGWAMGREGRGSLGDGSTRYEEIGCHVAPGGGSGGWRRGSGVGAQIRGCTDARLDSYD